MGIRDYKGSARAAYLSGDVDGSALVLPTTGLTGWPTGENGPFFAVINRQKPNEEKILVEAINGSDLQVLQRGADDTAAQTHNGNSIIEHVITATDAREANAHVNDHGAHIQSGAGDGDRPTDNLLPGQMYYDTTTKILWIYSADGDWEASTYNPQLGVDLDMKDTYRIINLVDPVDDQDGVTKSYLEGRIPELTGDDVELAKAWAIKMDGTVDGTDYSSKYHATEAKSDAAEAAASEAAAAEAAIQAGKYAASTAALWEDFDLRYLGAHPAPPTTGNPNPNDPDEPRPPVQEGSLYFNTVDNQMYVYDGSQWIVASSAAINTFDQFEWTATAGQTVFTTNKDMNPTMLQVYVNGVMVSKTDYTAAVRSVTLLEPAMAGDLVQVHSFQEATILSSVITSQDVDYVKVLPFEAWPIADPDDRTLYVVLPEAGKDYGTLWLGSVQIGGAGGGGLEGSPPPPINLRWNSDDPGVSDYRLLQWDSAGMGDAGPTIGYGVLPANDAAKETIITQADNSSMEARITGTKAGVEYAYKVFAANLAGPGESTEPITRMFPGPDAPTNVRSDPNDAFKLMWDHPGTAAILGDPNVDAYEVDNNIVSRASVSIDVSGKTATLDPNDYSANNQFYRFRVRAYGPDAGWSEWSEDFQREFVVPNAPTNVRCEGTTLMWDYVDVDTGPVTNWTFNQSHPVDSSPPNGGAPENVSDATFGSVTNNGNTYSLTVSDTTPFADYTFTVQATNQQGTGPVSMASAPAQFNYNDGDGGSSYVEYDLDGKHWRGMKFENSGTFNVKVNAKDWRILVIGGGGNGSGGGNGAGGEVKNVSVPTHLINESQLTVTVGGAGGTSRVALKSSNYELASARGNCCGNGNTTWFNGTSRCFGGSGGKVWWNHCCPANGDAPGCCGGSWDCNAGAAGKCYGGGGGGTQCNGSQAGYRGHVIILWEEPV